MKSDNEIIAVSDQLAEARRAEGDALQDLGALRIAYFSEVRELICERDGEDEKREMESSDMCDRIEMITEEVG